MIFDDDGRIRLTRSELARLRRYAARNGYALNAVSNNEDLLNAIVLGLPDETVRDLLMFLDGEDRTDV